MSIATLASDTAVSASSRLPTWMPQMVVRAISVGWRQPARWPFSSVPPKGGYRVRVPGERVAPSDVPVVNGASVVSQPVQPSKRSPEAVTVASEPPVSLPRDSLAAYHQSMGTASITMHQGLTLRQKMMDVFLVAIWAAIVPALMWLGAAAGF